MQNVAKFPGIPAGIFLKTYSLEFPGIPERELPVALIETLSRDCNAHKIRFKLDTHYLLGLVEGMDLHPHLYADDTQIYGFFAPDEASALQQRTSICVTQTSEWMKVNRLQLNVTEQSSQQ